MTTEYRTWQEWLHKERDKALYEEWDFSKFSIRCNKCKSFDTEINGKGALSTGYYEEPEHEGIILVKCHGCGEAMCIRIDDHWYLKSKKLKANTSLKKGDA